MKYSNSKVEALVNGQISISAMSIDDWQDLALAALDQGGMSVTDQLKVRGLLARRLTDCSQGAKDPETDRLITELEALGPYQGWRFTYAYPGYFCYSHPDNSYSVFFTPDWEGDEILPIEVQVDDGHYCEEHSSTLPLPREGRVGQKIFDLVRPTLDKLSKLPQPTASK